MTAFMTEDDAEKLILEYLAGMGWGVAFGPDIGPDGDHPERRDYRDAILPDRLRDSIRRLNPQLPPEAVDEAVRKVSLFESPSLVVNNRSFHKLLVEGVPVEFAGKDGPVSDDAKLIDFDRHDANDFLAVNQFTVVENSERRLDVVLFINGLPLVLFELKNPADEQATIEKAFRQLQTYKQEIPAVFQFNELLIISDGWNARVGTLTADWERFTPWRTIEGIELAPATTPGCEVVTKGIFEPKRLLDLIRFFIVFEDDGQDIAKKVAAYHQFHAVNKALERTVKASQPKGDRRIGVIWHTQGSGKSLSMAFFAGKVIQHTKMENPTLVVLTDRNDLDDQLFGTFSRCRALFRQEPVQAERSSDLKKLLSVASGGVIFTTIQKFLPEGEKYPKLSDRRNIVVIADEAHRSQYGFIDGLAKHMRDALPNASFIGFTGTPIELEDKSTPAVFGDYIDVYDIQRAVDDGATVPIYYEGRLAKLKLRDDKIPKVDKDFEEVTEGEEVDAKERLKSKWAKLEAMVGTKERIALVAQDIVDHFEKRLSAMDGKGMIVCMSRRICVELYAEIVKLRPQWQDADDKKGFLKVIMTGSASDKPEWQQHIRNKTGREALAKRFKKAKDPFKLAIVRDMWLTGFDAPCLHTMYADKPMRSHGLMQAIARVNRVFGNKPGGLIVDYLGLAYELKRAMADYTQAGGKGDQTIDLEEAVEAMLAKLEVVRDQFHGHDLTEAVAAPKAKRLQHAAIAMNFILQATKEQTSDERKKRYIKSVSDLASAFALAVPHDKAIAIRDELAFFQLVKSGLVKLFTDDEGKKRKKTPDELDTAVRQIVSGAVSSNEVIDIFKAAGLKRPDVSILSEEFLKEVRNMPHRNLALELLRKLLNDEIKLRGQRNIVQSQAFSEMLQKTILRYQNRTLEAAEVIAELIDLAKKVRDSAKRGDELGLSDDEIAFYDALEINDSAVKVLGEPTLKTIAQELVKTVRGSVTIDWNYRESAQAKIRLIVKKILRKYGYPPDKQQKAVDTVLEQAKLICRAEAA
jgi:type I restriction enzyme, R subunit